MNAAMLIATALPAELDHPNVLYTGVGKLNATYALTKTLQHGKPALVVNYGTAGGLNPTLTDLLEVAQVLQVDMIAEPLAARGHTPFDSAPFVLSSGHPGVVCGSGDHFVTAVDPWLQSQGVEVVDMELFAIASVCQREGVPWRAFKSISDHADRQAGTTWTDHFSAGQTAFLEQLERLRAEQS